MIPKTIFTTWISDSPFPKQWEFCLDSWRKHMPDYQIVILGKEHLKGINSLFVDFFVKEKNWVVVGHYLRNYYLLHLGGIYLDIDVELIKPINLTDDAFVGTMGDSFSNNAVMGSVAGHDFQQECLDYMDAIDVRLPCIENETGPRMITRILEKRGWDRFYHKQTITGVTIYPKEFFYPFNWTEKFKPECIKNETLGIHWWGSTWVKDRPQRLVSVIIPCYNYAKYLPECIESVRNQTYKNIEIIVVDDGSPDDTKEACERLKVRCISKENGGLSSARNAGIKEAAGEFIMCLDADDMLPPDSIELHMRMADDYVIAQCGLQEFGIRENRCTPQGAHRDMILQFNTVYCNAVFPKKAWESVGGYDESKTMRLGYEDWEFWVRLIARGCTVRTCDEVGLLYRIHMSSMTRTTSQINAGLLTKYIQDKNAKLFE